MGVGMLQIALQLAYGADYRAVPKKNSQEYWVVLHKCVDVNGLLTSSQCIVQSARQVCAVE